MKNHHSNLKQYVNDVIALEREIENAISRQIEDDRVKANKKLTPLLDQIIRESKERMKELKVISDEEGGKLGAVVKETAMSVTGTLAGLYGKVREHPVSRMVRDDIIALHVLMISYGMLRTLGLSAGHGETASISLKGLEQMPPLIVPLTDLLPTIVTLEISEDDPISNPAAAQTVCADMRGAWKLTAPV